MVKKNLPITLLLFLSFLVSISFAAAVHAHSGNSYDHDRCKDILRDGVKDELEANSSSKHKLVKHHQFCSIAKKHELSESSFESFAKDYGKLVKESNFSLDGDVNVIVPPVLVDAGYEQNSHSSSLSESEKIKLVKDIRKKILDYYSSNCGNSSYEDHLETEANLTTRIANKDIVKGWSECMVKRHGTFAYPVSMDEDLLLFSVRVEYLDVGTRHIKSLSLQWFGDNIATICDDNNVSKKTGNGRKTGELLNPPEKVILSGANIEIPLKRSDNKQNDIVWIDTMTGDGVTGSFSFKLPKMVEIVIPEPREDDHFSIEYQCNNPKCSQCGKKHIQELDQKDEYIFSQYEIDSYECKTCSKKMALQYVFKDCFYKIHGQAEHGGFAFSPWSLAGSLARTFTVNHDDKRSTRWQKLKIHVREKDFQPEKEEF